MNNYDIVPMNISAENYPADTYLSANPRHIEEEQMSRYVSDILAQEQARLRNKNNFNWFGFEKQVMPDDVVVSLRSKDPMGFYSREGGTFSVSELNRLLQDDYNARLYDLIQSKNRAGSTQNILKNVLDVIRGK